MSSSFPGLQTQVCLPLFLWRSQPRLEVGPPGTLRFVRSADTAEVLVLEERMGWRTGTPTPRKLSSSPGL